MMNFWAFDDPSNNNMFALLESESKARKNST
jgi:hypothetical protein